MGGGAATKGSSFRTRPSIFPRRVRVLVRKTMKGSNFWRLRMDRTLKVRKSSKNGPGRQRRKIEFLIKSIHKNDVFFFAPDFS